MENASKALIIAGAILISILLIAISMYIYNSAQSTINTAASQMGQQEKQMYNSMIEKYVGTKKGTEVKQMINDIISQNNQYVGETGKFIGIDASGVPGCTDAKYKTIGDDANAYITQGAENTQEKIDGATTLMREVSQKIIAGKNYTVSADGGTTDGIIHKVTITPLDNN